MKKLSLLLLLLLAGCGNDNDHPWLGYAEGDAAFIAPPQAGWVSHMNIHRGDWVKRGELLFTLDDTRETAARDQARAQIALADGQMGEAQASLTYANREFQRQSGLLRASAGTQQAYDLARSNRDQAQARIDQINAQKSQAEATLADSSYQLSQRDVVALTEGRVQDIYYWPGEYAPAMTPVVSVLPPDRVFVRFFVPETELAKIRLGQKVAISCDGCAKNITATVSFIASQEEFTPPVIFSIGSREKLVFKVEARTAGGLKLNPGQPVEVRPL